MTANLDSSIRINMKKAFKAIEAGRKSVHVELDTYYQVGKRELGAMFKENALPLLQEIRNPKLMPKGVLLAITIFTTDKSVDMGMFWFKADYLRSIVQEVLGAESVCISTKFKRRFRKTSVDVVVSWREEGWSGNAKGLVFDQGDDDEFY